MSLKEKISHLACYTSLDNAAIAKKLGCSERSVRRYARGWKSRIVNAHAPGPKSAERKVIFLYDVHMPYENDDVYQTALDYAIQWKPDEIILGGDFVDFKDISFWKDDPQRMSFKEEIDYVKDELSDLRHDFPKTVITYLEGNHEHRLARYMWTKAPELCGIPELAFEKLMGLKEFGIKYISNVDRLNNGLTPYRLGKLYVLHGHEVQLGSGAVNLARTMYLKTHVNVIFGHHHQSQSYIFKKLDNTYEGSWLVGGLCNLSENYQPSNNWINGFCTVKYNLETGYFKVRNKLIINGQVL